MVWGPKILNFEGFRRVLGGGGHARVRTRIRAGGILDPPKDQNQRKQPKTKAKAKKPKAKDNGKGTILHARRASAVADKKICRNI